MDTSECIEGGGGHPAHVRNIGNICGHGDYTLTGAGQRTQFVSSLVELVQIACANAETCAGDDVGARHRESESLIRAGDNGRASF
jgi:hypothetical protein